LKIIDSIIVNSIHTNFIEMKRTTDDAGYTEKLRRQTMPGRYQYEAPTPQQYGGIPSDVVIRPQYSGAALSMRYTPAEVESDLWGLGRPLTRQVHGNHHFTKTNPFTNDLRQFVVPITGLTTTHNRLELPPTALKGMGKNRFDILPHNPADKAFQPFDTFVSSRIVAKDQNRSQYSSHSWVNPSTGMPSGDEQSAYSSNDTGMNSNGYSMKQCSNVDAQYYRGVVYNEPKPDSSCAMKVLDNAANPM
jgi:hypothetical protein